MNHCCPAPKEYLNSHGSGALNFKKCILEQQIIIKLGSKNQSEIQSISYIRSTLFTMEFHSYQKMVGYNKENNNINNSKAAK